MELKLNQNESKQYLDDLILLFSKFNSNTTNNSFSNKIIPYLSMLQFQIATGISKELQLNHQTGIPAYTELSKIHAQRTILDKKKKGVLTPLEIQQQLISQIDSNYEDFLFQEHLSLMANSVNIQELSKISQDLTQSSKREILDTGSSSDLYQIKMDGYSHTEKTFLEYTLEFYLSKKKSKLFQKETGATQKDFSGVFGHRSDEIYLLLTQDENVESVRTVERKIIGPYLTQNLVQSEKTQNYNPNIEKILTQAKQEDVNLSSLFYHGDETTPNFFDQDNLKSPTIKIEHKYITNDEISKQFLKNLVSSEQVI